MFVSVCEIISALEHHKGEHIMTEFIYLGQKSLQYWGTFPKHHKYLHCSKMIFAQIGQYSLRLECAPNKWMELEWILSNVISFTLLLCLCVEVLFINFVFLVFLWTLDCHNTHTSYLQFYNWLVHFIVKQTVSIRSSGWIWSHIRQ